MIIDGKKINREIMEELRASLASLSLAIVLVGDDPVTAKYVEKKKKFGEEIGVRVEVFKYGSTSLTTGGLGILTGELVTEIKNILAGNPSGIIVQLPLPKNIDTQMILNILPIDKDVDLLSDAAYQSFVDGKSKILPPVTGAIKEILERGGIKDLHGLNAVIVGRGKLVGRPAAVWFANQGAKVDLLGRDTKDLAPFIKKADIVIAGAGVPNLIKPEMLPEKADTKLGGVIIIDAATSDVSGKIVGDVDLACAEKSLIFSPVPGGVGPITVAMLFKNLSILNGNN